MKIDSYSAFGIDFFTNPWFVGIVGGILSGIIVTSITNFLYSKKERRNYFQKVAIANNEIIYAIRPVLAEKTIPEMTVFDALISATAVKYSIDKKDLFDLDVFIDILIKEVMDNAFLSSTQKAEFCKLLSELKNKLENHVVEGSSPKRPTRSENVSVLLGVVTGATTLMAALLGSRFNEMVTYQSERFDKFFVVFVILMILVPVVAVGVGVLFGMKGKNRALEAAAKAIEKEKKRNSLWMDFFKKNNVNQPGKLGE